MKFVIPAGWRICSLGETWPPGSAAPLKVTALRLTPDGVCSVLYENGHH